MRLLSITLLLFLAQAVPAQHGDHRHEPPDKVGRVSFTISCAPQAQKQFNRAVAWLHSFEYEEAEKAFTQVAATDPRCGMAYWGVAMSNYHPLWAPPTPDELKGGWDAVEKAKLTSARTQRERHYIAAIEAFYKDAESRDHRTRGQSGGGSEEGEELLRKTARLDSTLRQYATGDQRSEGVFRRSFEQVITVVPTRTRARETCRSV